MARAVARARGIRLPRRTLALAALSAVVATSAPAGEANGERRLREVQLRQAAQQEARAARVRRERQRRHSAMGAHARMPSTMYASTPSPPDAAPYCPVLRDEPPEKVYDRIIRERGGSDAFRPSGAAVPTFAVQRQAPGRLAVPDQPVAATADGPAWAVASSTATAEAQARSGAAIGDLDGDGSDDVVLRHADGRWRYYAMNGRRHVAPRSGVLGIPADPAWAFAGIGDLNGDGRADILSRHPDGRWRYHAMDGKDRLAAESGEAALPADPAWRLAGVGDFDGDGFDDDVLLRHAGTGRWRYVPMDGRGVGDGEGGANLSANPSWTVAGIGDLNGDGRDDVLLRHADTSRWYYYPMDGRTALDGRGAANLSANAAWTFAGIGDLNGDGKDDVLLRHADTSRWHYYPMNGRTVLSGRGGAALSSNAAWTFAGMGDLDGDGTADDVLLRRADTGRWHYSPMNGRTAGSGRGSANLTPDLAWRPAGAVAAEIAYRDCPACPRMVDVPAGSYARGSPSAEALRSADEGPRRRVAFAEPFALAETETTYAEWQACVDGGGCGGHVPAGAAEASGGRPVVDVTWAQAGSYADWLSGRTGEPYRLPSEAEWEYAARAGTATPFHTGATISTEQANYDGTLPPYGGGAAGEFRGATVAVGAFPPNAFGLRDMHGNAAEWTADCHAPNYRNAPTDGSAADSAGCSERVLRGGSWRDGPEELRSANRTAAAEGWHGGTAGFRVAKDLSAPTDGGETAAEAFAASVSPIVQAKCVNCHVEGGASGHTPLVFVTDADADHLARNLKAFEDYVAAADGGAERILNKAQGVEHGGGVQLAAGTEGFAALERFLGLLGGDASPGTSVTVATLFDGVRMEPARSTLRRAAIVFAGRIPTEAEYASIESGGITSLREAIRGLMTGPAFHEFLIRASNDRLLTDRREGVGVVEPIFGYFAKFNSLRNEKALGEDADYWRWYDDTDHGLLRAPLELVAHVVENDLPYTEILTADYIMANPPAAEAYGADTEFLDATDVHEFQPSRIVSYYRQNDFAEHTVETDYPHAGILNTTVFLKRYPTTATNRNRARSRWTYYHFLGVDIEKSASRTTDPVALADTNNPTMLNPACTVCHSVLDPVAGVFQNYDDIGYYRSGLGGLDSLDYDYKDGLASAALTRFKIHARSWEERETVWTAKRLDAGEHTVGLATLSHDYHSNIHVDYLIVRDADGTIVSRDELEDATDGECGDTWTGNTYELVHCPLVVPVALPAAGTYEFETAAYVGYQDEENVGKPASLAMWVPYDEVYREGDAWYRDMRAPGFGSELAPSADNSLQWLAERIVSDGRFAEATVKFWWPAVMGSDVAEAPSEGDADFAGRLLASNAQASEVARLAGGFRRGFAGGERYDLKHLLTEIALSKWFRAESVTGDDPVRAAALSRAGAKRLLTPEELARKTVAVTGFDWLRSLRRPWDRPAEALNWTNVERSYGLLYGGIDSDGITRRSRDLTSVMAGVAKRHAAASACPIVMKDFYLVKDEKRRLFGGIDATTALGRTTVTPAAERSIRAKLVELHRKLLGAEVDTKSPDIEAAFDLFVDAWRRGRMSDRGDDFRELRCAFPDDRRYFDGILDDHWTTNEEGHVDWDYGRVDDFIDKTDMADPHHVARTWVVVLAYLMTDPRYLHL